MIRDVAHLIELPWYVFPITAMALAKGAVITKETLAAHTCVCELVCVVVVHEQFILCDVSAHFLFNA